MNGYLINTLDIIIYGPGCITGDDAEYLHGTVKVTCGSLSYHYDILRQYFDPVIIIREGMLCQFLPCLDPII